MKTRNGRRKYGIALAAAVLLWALPCAALAEEVRQYKIEAAFLYNFFNYITWPGYSSPAALKQPVICVYEDGSIESYLAYMQQKVAAERKLTIRMLHKDDSAGGCNLLLINTTDNMALKNSLAPDILTVSDKEGYLKHGGMIELVQEDERIVMKINHSLLRENGFTVSSRLLDLAQGVE